MQQVFKVVADVLRQNALRRLGLPSGAGRIKALGMGQQREQARLHLHRYLHGVTGIEVAECTVEPAPQWARPILPLDSGEAIRRQRGKIGQGKVQRLPWSDESARAAVLGSRFIKHK